MEKYEITIDINTNGNFRYDGMNIKVEYADTLEMAYLRFHERIRNIINSMSSTYHKDVVEKYKRFLEVLVDEGCVFGSKFEEFKDRFNKYEVDGFSFSNYDGYFAITKMDQIEESGVMSIKPQNGIIKNKKEM